MTIRNRILAGALAVSMLTGCAGGQTGGSSAGAAAKISGEKGETITFCIDKSYQDELESLETCLHEMYKNPLQVEFLVLPESGAEREAELTRLQTEIMAGKGPDAFVLECGMDGHSEWRPKLFDDTNKALHGDVFLPLDKLFASSKMLDLSTYQPKVLDACKTDKGLMAVPLQYTYNFIAVDPTEMRKPDAPLKSFSDMLSSGEPAVVYGLRFAVREGGLCNFPQMADYASENMLVSEDTFITRAKQGRVAPGEPRPTKGVEIQRAIATAPLSSGQSRLFPLYNTSGGITANITAFAAISASSAHPEKAFSLLELFLRDEVQGGEGIPGEEKIYGYGATDFLSGLLPKEKLLKKMLDKNEDVEKQYKEEILKMNKEVDTVRFSTKADWELVQLMQNFDRKSEPALNEAYKQLYQEIQMSLSE